jgi:general L-amino acid transport system permease protein
VFTPAVAVSASHSMVHRLLFSERARSLSLQIGLIGAVAALVVWVAGNVEQNLNALGISLSFGSFDDAAGFPISETLPVPFFGLIEVTVVLLFLAGLAVSLRCRLIVKKKGVLRHGSMRESALVRLPWLALPLVGWLILAAVLGKWSTLSWGVYAPESPYLLALAVGFLNTLKVAALGIPVATVLGLAIGLMRVSAEPGLRILGRSYVEVLRNVPLLLQLVFWYALVLNIFPLVQDGLNIRGAVFLNNRGLFMPEPVIRSGHGDVSFFVFSIGISLLWLLSGRLVLAQARQRTSTPINRLRDEGAWVQGFNSALNCCLRHGRMCAVLLWLSAAACVVGAGYLVDLSLEFNLPELVFGGRNLRGGWTLTPEFLALVLGLSVYTAAFVAEIVRSGLGAVEKGQVEAARALGLSSGQTLQLVVLPQALRVMVPPITSQYLNLVKNSSLAVAVGYPELVSVGGTILNQTGKSVEIILIWMVVYLTLSLAISVVMNVYNAQVKIVGR